MERNDIPYIAFESEMARHERTIKRLLIALAASIFLLFVTNIAWLWFFNQFDFATDTVSQGTEAGDNSYIGAGASGYITNGESDDN